MCLGNKKHEGRRSVLNGAVVSAVRDGTFPTSCFVSAPRYGNLSMRRLLSGTTGSRAKTSQNLFVPQIYLFIKVFLVFVESLMFLSASAVTVTFDLQRVTGSPWSQRGRVLLRRTGKNNQTEFVHVVSDDGHSATRRRGSFLPQLCHANGPSAPVHIDGAFGAFFYIKNVAAGTTEDADEVFNPEPVS